MAETQKPRIIIDPGHGTPARRGTDPGVTFGSISERDEVLKVAEALVWANRQAGTPYEVHLTRETNTSGPDRSRGEGTWKLGTCDVYVALHMDMRRGRTWIMYASWGQRFSPKSRDGSRRFNCGFKLATLLATHLNTLQEKFMIPADRIRRDTENPNKAKFKKLYISDTLADASILWEICEVQPLNHDSRAKLADKFWAAMDQYLKEIHWKPAPAPAGGTPSPGGGK